MPPLLFVTARADRYICVFSWSHAGRWECLSTESCKRRSGAAHRGWRAERVSSRANGKRPAATARVSVATVQRASVPITVDLPGRTTRTTWHRFARVSTASY